MGDLVFEGAGFGVGRAGFTKPSSLLTVVGDVGIVVSLTLILVGDSFTCVIWTFFLGLEKSSSSSSSTPLDARFDLGEGETGSSFFIDLTLPPLLGGDTFSTNGLLSRSFSTPSFDGLSLLAGLVREGVFELK